MIPEKASKATLVRLLGPLVVPGCVAVTVLLTAGFARALPLPDIAGPGSVGKELQARFEFRLDEVVDPNGPGLSVQISVDPNHCAVVAGRKDPNSQPSIELTIEPGDSSVDFYVHGISEGDCDLSASYPTDPNTVDTVYWEAWVVPAGVEIRGLPLVPRDGAGNLTGEGFVVVVGAVRDPLSEPNLPDPNEPGVSIIQAVRSGSTLSLRVEAPPCGKVKLSSSGSFATSVDLEIKGHRDQAKLRLESDGCSGCGHEVRVSDPNSLVEVTSHRREFCQGDNHLFLTSEEPLGATLKAKYKVRFRKRQGSDTPITVESLDPNVCQVSEQMSEAPSAELSLTIPGGRPGTNFWVHADPIQSDEGRLCRLALDPQNPNSLTASIPIVPTPLVFKGLVSRRKFGKFDDFQVAVARNGEFLRDPTTIDVSSTDPLRVEFLEGPNGPPEIEADAQETDKLTVKFLLTPGAVLIAEADPNDFPSSTIPAVATLRVIGSAPPIDPPIVDLLLFPIGVHLQNVGVATISSSALIAGLITVTDPNVCGLAREGNPTEDRSSLDPNDLPSLNELGDTRFLVHGKLKLEDMSETWCTISVTASNLQPGVATKQIEVKAPSAELVFQSDCDVETEFSVAFGIADPMKDHLDLPQQWWTDPNDSHDHLQICSTDDTKAFVRILDPNAAVDPNNLGPDENGCTHARPEKVGELGVLIVDVDPNAESNPSALAGVEIFIGGEFFEPIVSSAREIGTFETIVILTPSGNRRNVAAGLMRQFTVELCPGHSDTGAVTIELTDPNEGICELAAGQLDAGSVSISVPMSNGQTQELFWIHGLEADRTIREACDLTAKRTVYFPGTYDFTKARIVNPAVHIEGLGRIVQVDSDEPFRVKIGVPRPVAGSASGTESKIPNRVDDLPPQLIRTGGPGIHNVEIRSDDTTIAKISLDGVDQQGSITLDFPAGSINLIDLTFHPQGTVGEVTITVGQDPNADGKTVIETTKAATKDVSVDPDRLDLEVPPTLGLGLRAPGEILTNPSSDPNEVVTLTTNKPARCLLSSDGGTTYESIDLLVPSDPNATVVSIDFWVHGISEFGKTCEIKAVRARVALGNLVTDAPIALQRARMRIRDGLDPDLPFDFFVDVDKSKLFSIVVGVDVNDPNDAGEVVLESQKVDQPGGGLLCGAAIECIESSPTFANFSADPNDVLVECETYAGLLLAIPDGASSTTGTLYGWNEGQTIMRAGALGGKMSPPEEFEVEDPGPECN